MIVLLPFTKCDSISYTEFSSDVSSPVSDGFFHHVLFHSYHDEFEMFVLYLTLQYHQEMYQTYSIHEYQSEVLRQNPFFWNFEIPDSLKTSKTNFNSRFSGMISRVPMPAKRNFEVSNQSFSMHKILGIWK